MGVPFYDFANLHNKEFKDEIRKRFDAIIEKNAFVEGEYNQRFEKRFAELQGAKHCALVANGTDAIFIALKAYDVGVGDLVGIPGISFFATAEAVLAVGAIPVFVDVNPQTGLMDPASLERILKKHTLKAIIPVHIYGQPAPIEELERICKPKGISIVEDAAQGQGGFLKNGPIGSSANLTTFSFYPTKNLSAFGDAGAILTQDDKLAEKIISYRNHGRSPNGHTLSGYNSRCDHLQASVLDLKLDKINDYNNKRKEVAKIYHEKLKGLPLRLVPEEFLMRSSWHLYPIGLKSKEEKEKLQGHLKTFDIATALFYTKSLPEELPLQNFAGEKEQAISFAQKTLCLPINPFLTNVQVEEVAKRVKEFLT